MLRDSGRPSSPYIICIIILNILSCTSCSTELQTEIPFSEQRLFLVTVLEGMPYFGMAWESAGMGRVLCLLLLGSFLLPVGVTGTKSKDDAPTRQNSGSWV